MDSMSTGRCGWKTEESIEGSGWSVVKSMTLGDGLK